MKNQAISIIKQAFSVTAIAVIFAIAAFGQSNTGSISGVITDQNGAVVANATVTITNAGTNEKRTAQTDGEGRYEIPVLPTGTYTVEVTASGFKGTGVKDLRLAVGEKARADLALGLTGVDAVVTVIDQTRTNVESSTVGDTITSERIQNNPVNGRDFTGLLATIPGSVQSTNQFQTSINGIPSTFGGASVLVDGIDAGRIDLNGTSNVLGRIESRVNRVSMDSIQEVQVVESNYSAQYGGALSAVVNPITKSGTNNFHGSAFDYIRNESLDANDFFNNALGFPRSNFKLNQFGGSIGGPIKQDKLFFFANYEGVRQTRGQLFNSLTPTASFRAAMAPALAAPVATLPLPFTSNQCPIQVSPNATDCGPYSVQKDGKLREDTGSIKIDWNQSQKSQFSARYNINDSDTTSPYGVGTDQTATGTLRVQLFKLSHNYVFNGNTVNEAAFGINNNKTNPTGGPSPFPIFSFIFGDAAVANIGPAQFDQYRAGTVYQFLDTLSLVRGNHSFKTGIDIRLNRRAASSKTQTTLQFGSLSDLKVNNPFIISTGGNPLLHYANENFAFFGQDDWKVHPRLTLNIGLRYDVSTVSREKDGNLQNFDVVTHTLGPKGEKVYNVDKNNFAPRFGFAFDVFGKQKTVLRGGYGIYFNRELPASWGSPQANTYPTSSISIGDLFGFGYCPVAPATFGYPVNPNIFNGCGTSSKYSIDRNLKTASAQQWSLNVQQDIKFGVLQVGYVGNHVTHLLTDGVVSPRNVNRADIDFFGFNLRKLPQFGDIFIVGSYPSSIYHAMQVTFKRNYSKGLQYNFNYTWSHTIDDVVGFFKDYQNEFDNKGERASSDQDIRHNFTVDASYDLPFNRWWPDGPKRLVNGWQVSSVTQVRSALPVNVTNQGGTFGGYSFRPNIVPGVSTRCPNYNVPNCQYNVNAFVSAGVNTPGNTPRNYLRGRPFAQSDISISKATRITEKTSLQLKMDIFNFLNMVNFADPSGGVTTVGAVGNNALLPTANFGRSISTVGNLNGGLLGFGGPRQIQLSARFTF